MTAVGGDYVEPPDPGCWCCGDRTVRASLLQLDAHREVGVCFRCVDYLNKRKRAIQRMTRRAPLVHGGNGWCSAPGSTDVERDMVIACAECGCLAEGGVIVTPCDSHPECCCAEVPVQPSE